MWGEQVQRKQVQREQVQRVHNEADECIRHSLMQQIDMSCSSDVSRP